MVTGISLYQKILINIMNDVKVERITAPNGSVFTGAGTNTYLVGENDISIVDPGPNIKSHLDKIIKKVGKNASRILVTHTHRDHSPGAKYLAEKLNIPTFGKLVEVDDSHQDLSFKPDHVLNHGDLITTDEYSLEAVYTPGHASNHFCFFIDVNALMLTGDHIMNGSTVVIAHPDGSISTDQGSVFNLLHRCTNTISNGNNSREYSY